jgi:hypothetical protein
MKLDYAFGLFVSDEDGKREVYHSGATAGWRAFLTRKIDDDLSIAVLCNRGDAGVGGLTEKVAAVFVKPADVPAPAKGPSSPSNLTGLYRDMNTDAILRIISKDDGLHLALRANGNGPLLTPTAAGHYKLGSTNELWLAADGLHVTSGHRPEAIYARVADATPSTAKLSEYAGAYSSDEVGATYTMVVEDGKLVAKVNPVIKTRLDPTYADAFVTERGDLVRFTRDLNGRITGADIKTDFGPMEGLARIERMHFVRK